MLARLDVESYLKPLMILAPAGFAIALHVRFTTPSYLFQTYPKAWIDHYSQNGLVMRDPTVAWGFENTGTVDWADLVSLDTAGVMAEASKYGMKYGFTYVIDRANSRSLSSFTRSDREFTQDEVAAICAKVDALHDRTVSLQTVTKEASDELVRLSVVFSHP